MKRINRLQTVSLAIALLTLLAGVAAADSSTTSHGMIIEIPRIMMLEVRSNWTTDTVSTSESGATVATASTTYGVTSTVEHAVIQATLESSLPHGVVARIRMQTEIGRSTGWVQLREGMPVDLVSDARGNEYNVAEMQLSVPAGMSISSVPLSIAYGIN